MATIISLSLLYLSLYCTAAFVAPTVNLSACGLYRISSVKELHNEKNTENDGIDLDDLLPPLVRFRRESTLFGEKPATKRNNQLLELWRGLKTSLPSLVTGAGISSNTGDDNPFGAVYNMLLVRIPVIATGIIYTRNMLEGHPVMVDIGFGPTELNPILVYGFMAMILL